MRELTSYAKGLAHVVLYSPRRFGKTSLARRVQKELADGGAITFYADLFGVTSVEDVAERLARAVYEKTHQQKTLFNKAVTALKSFRPVIRPDEQGGVAISVEPATTRLAGTDLLADTLEAIGRFIDSTGQLVHIALDEFQEIVELREAIKIEGIMRAHLQNHQAPYFFIGSRRRVLVAIFNDRQRPFVRARSIMSWGSSRKQSWSPLSPNDLPQPVLSARRQPPRK
jgi:AAA+ ATPase superfamily predicted ATPase